MKNLNFELLKDLYKVFSPSMEEKKMRRFIKKYIKNNVPDVVVTQDGSGNLLVTKGEAGSYACLCAHMDQVQKFHPKDFTCIDDGGVIMGYSSKTRKQCGLGADDKNGIFIALTCLEEYDNIKCAFFVGEEIGCVGSSAVDVSFFSDCRFCVQIDRQGNCDMVTRISWDAICSEEFVKDSDCGTWGYCESDGLMTDVEALRRNGVTASCINLSCGYYEPHTDHEFTVKEDVQKCYEFVCHLIDHCVKGYQYFGESYGDGERDRFDRGWGYSEADCQFDECCDICIETLEQNPQMTEMEFESMMKDSYKRLKRKDFVEIFRISQGYVGL